ncbi:RIMS-binding protein 2 isoform X1 [Boleophthalmus pectinirostris]|uniref:RIMS-binding protein 2 isoform X1 n=1 Tax=Boleophthalmus pectinirostris TaxID=150288 RepID=UPI002432D0EF|nr:RIMS-binding protein 2 isoform X1 [Boleophthalmus pectinirostris]
MKNKRDNPQMLSCNNPYQDHYGRELSKLQAALKAEELLSQQIHQNLRLDLQHLREEAEKRLHIALLEFMSKRVCQIERSCIKPGRREKHHFKSNQDHQNVTCTRLEQLLKIYDKINLETAYSELHHRQELDLEKALLLCHVLETNDKLLSQRQGHPSDSGIIKQILTKIQDIGQLKRHVTYSRVKTTELYFRSVKKRTEQRRLRHYPGGASITERGTCPRNDLKICQLGDAPHVDGRNSAFHSTESSGSDRSLPSQCAETNMENGTDYNILVRQNSELLRALDALEKTCATLREENGLLRKSSAPETEEKVRRLRRKNTELAVLAKRLEDRARKLQEANLRVVNPPLMRPGSVEQYKRAFARQRARDLAQHADVLLCKDKEIASLQQECRDLEAQLGTTKRSPVSCGEIEKLLRESQKEVLRLQRQLSVTSCRQQHSPVPPDDAVQCGGTEKRDEEKKVVGETPFVAFDEVSQRNEKTPREEEEELGQHLTPVPGLSPTPSQKEEQPQDHLHFLESELSKKRKECENLEHEVKKRQRRCLDLESQLEEERCKNEQLTEETDLLRRKAQLLYQTQTENEELREDLSEVTAQHNSVLEENQRLRAKLENLEQVLKHMREVAERRQQLELEHEQALAILKFKQDEIKRLQRAQLFAKREHEGVVQMLEDLVQLVLERELSKVRDLEEKCRGQSEQFGLLSQELEKFRMQASKVDLAASALPNNPCLSVLTNGLGLTADRDVAAALGSGATPHAAGLSRVQRSPVTKHRELPTISVSKSLSSSSKSEATRLTPKSDTHLSPHKSSPTHEVDTASEVEELDIDVAPAPYTVNRGASKLQVFIARYSYNPYDGPNDNPEVELPLTAGEYIYVYGDMDEDGFYEGELMDGRRGLVPSNFVERVSDDEVIGSHHPETVDISHNSLLDSSLHSASHQHYLHTGVSASQRTEASAAPGPAYTPVDPALALAVPAPLTNGLDLDFEEVGVDIVPYPRKLTLIKQLAKSIIIGWDPPSVPAGWGNVLSYNVYVDQELRLNVPFGSQNKAVLERLDINLKTYRVSVQSLTEKGPSDQLQCSMLVGRDVSVAPTQLNIDRVTATTANLSWLPSNSNYVHIVSLNGEEYELVKAGCYSLCLTNLCPSLQYTVKVEARPHRTPWELPAERREHRVTTVTFKTLMAGPPDAPLDVQLEQGPSPGIALISWLPVTIDAAGTSNGVRVTGYSIYADKRKVLEVSSPTAGSVLLGPSQIQSLQGARELTVRSMSAHGESCDSLPVILPFKMDTLLTGPPITPPVVLPPPCVPVSPCSLPSPSFYGNAPANVSMLPSTSLPNTQATSHVVEPFANQPNALAPEDPCPMYVQAWANPSSAAALAIGDSVLPAASNSPPMVSVRSPITRMPTQGAVLSAAALVQSRDTDSPGLIRPFPSITEFIEDPCAKLEPIPPPPKATTTDLLCPKDIRLLRPPSTSPLDSEVEEEQENTRLVSIEEFLRQDQEPASNTRQQTYGKGLVEPLSDYHADNSRSDLSDILEEEEEDLSSDHLGETQTMGYIAAANRLKETNPVSPGEAGPSWRDQAPQLSKSTAKHNRLPKGCIESPKAKGGCSTRLFVALFSYDPASMSPNPGAVEEELPFNEGQIIQVFGDKDADGFYHGECAGRVGLVPCNMVSEIQVEDEETRQHLLKQGALSTVGTIDKLEPNEPPAVAGESRAVGGVAAPLLNPGPETRKMVAIFDYDPRESSPNTDIEAELTFSAGDIIHVMGDMDEDGFFYGELNGQRGLVPSNFLQALLESNSAAPPPPDPKRESQAPEMSYLQDLEPPAPQEAHCTDTEAPRPDQMKEAPGPVAEQAPEPVTPAVELMEALPDAVPAPQGDSPIQAKKKKSFFSKGKRLFKKLGSSKKE